MNFRILTINDYIQFKNLINDFRKTDFTEFSFKNFIENEKNISIYILQENNNILAAGTILFERKFIHNISLYGHIEDIIVKKEHQKKGYGKLLINKLIDVCKTNNCYKILLDCSNELVPFYEKCGFKLNSNQMVIYL